MSRIFQIIRIFLLGAFALNCDAAPSGNLTQALSLRGEGARTLLIYSGKYAPYSLADDLAALKLQLRRVESDVDAVECAEAEVSAVAAADYVVIFCPQPNPDIPENLLRAIADRQTPALWVGYGADKLEKYPQFQKKFKVATFASEKKAELITYQGRNWEEPLAMWLPVHITTTNSNVILMTSVPRGGETKAGQPFAWRLDNFTFYAALPNQTANCALFDDLLMDFYGVTNLATSAVSVRIDGYHCRQDHAEFRNLVKALSERGHPFTVGVIPAFYDAEQDKMLDLDSQPEFVAALRYAQQHGGRLLMQGYSLGAKGRQQQLPEFWDNTSDRPLADEKPEDVRQRIEKGLLQMFAKGLLPLGWSTPYHSASQADYREIARFFSTSVERVQLSDATARANFAPTGVTRDEAGRLIIPENLGVAGVGYNAMARMRARAEVLTQLRGTVSAFSFPAYLTDDKLVQAITAVEQTKSPFLDIADGDHWVQAGDLLLLTGGARRAMTLNNARVYWKAFDRSGHQIAEELEPMSATGERLFTRKGKGDYEIFQIIQGKP